MDIDLNFKIAAVGIIVSILNQVLVRSGREEQATMTSLAALVVVLMIVVQRIAELFDMVKTRCGASMQCDLPASEKAGTRVNVMSVYAAVRALLFNVSSFFFSGSCFFSPACGYDRPVRGRVCAAF